MPHSPLREMTLGSAPEGTGHDLPEDGKASTVYPGIVLAGLITAASFSLREVPGPSILSPMILAVVLGIIYANVVGLPSTTRAGLALCQRTLLRLGIVLLGFQLTTGQLSGFGMIATAIVVLALATTFVFTLGLGKLLSVDARLTQLIAAGTSICGASAIVAANAVTRARDEDVAYAIASITLFGTLAMLAYPLLAPMIGLDAFDAGLWVGASIHEVAQVVGAGFQLGETAGEAGVVAKLVRVAMLAPVVLLLGYLVRRRSAAASSPRPPFPWFVLGFVMVVVANSLLTLPDALPRAAATSTTLLLTLGLGAVGLQTNVAAIRSRGIRPLLVAFLSFLFIAAISLLLVKFPL